MSEDGKKTDAEGRLAAPTPAGGGGDPAQLELLKTVGQRGPGRRSAQFVEKIANAYGMLPGDLLAATLMGGLRAHLEAGNAADTYLVERARSIASQLNVHKGEAMSLLTGVAKELMPYLHQKQPQAHDVDLRAIIFAAVNADGTPAQPGGHRDLRPADVRAPIDAAATSARSDADGRTDNAKPLKDKPE